MLMHRRKTDERKKNQRFGDIIKNNFQQILLIGVFFFGIGIMCFSMETGSNKINNEKNAIFENLWEYRVDDGVFSEVVLPSRTELSSSSHITLKNDIPVEMVKGATLLIRTSQQDVDVLVDGRVIYSSYDKEENKPNPSSAYHFVRLPTNSAGEPVTVILSSPFQNYVGFMNQIHIGSKASNIFFLLHENGLRLMIGFLIFSMGFLMMMMFLFVKEKENRGSFSNLGALFVCAGYWVMVESKLMQFIIPYPMALTNTSIFALSLLPVFSGLYYYNTHVKIYKKIGRVIIGIVITCSFLLAIAACLDPWIPIRVLPIYLIFILIYLLLIFVSILIERDKEEKLGTISVLGMISFGACCFFELTFYLLDMKAYNQSNFLTQGLLLFSIAMIVDSVQTFIRVYHDSIKVDTLSVLAYTDSLTGLRNRTAFLEEISKIMIEEGMAVTIGMYDLNNLKEVNDIMGHLVGDALIRHSVKVMKESLREEDQLYRIGGDEFVGIIYHGIDFDEKNLELRMLSIVKKENKKKLNYTLSIAYGFATFSEELDKTLFETQVRADKKMYACKKNQKKELGKRQ